MKDRQGPELEFKEWASHYKGIIKYGGHIGLVWDEQPSLVFKAYGVIQRRYVVRIPLVDIAEIDGWDIRLDDGTTHQFIVGSRAGLRPALLQALGSLNGRNIFRAAKDRFGDPRR